MRFYGLLPVNVFKGRLLMIILTLVLHRRLGSLAFSLIGDLWMDVIVVVIAQLYVA